MVHQSSQVGAILGPDPDAPVQSSYGQLVIEAGGDLRSHDTPGENIEDERGISSASEWPDAGDLRDSQPIGSGGGEMAFNEVGRAPVLRGRFSCPRSLACETPRTPPVHMSRSTVQHATGVCCRHGSA